MKANSEPDPDISPPEIDGQEKPHPKAAEDAVTEIYRDIVIARERDLFSKIIDGLPGTFYLLNRKGRFVKWNRHLEEISEFTSEEMASAHPLDFFADEDRTTVEGRIKEVLKTGFAEIEADLVIKSGRRIPHYFNGVLIDIDGEPHVMGMGLDISARKSHEQELEKTNYLLEMVLNSIPHGVFWKDRNSIYLGSNAPVGNMAGFSDPSDIIGKSDLELPNVPREQAESFIEKDREVMETGIPQSGIVNAGRGPDGRHFLLETSKVPLRDPQGDIVGVLGTWTDITEKRRLEEQLRQAQKMEAFGQLAAGVAHDFNNLLTVITGYSDILLMNLAEEDPRRGAVVSIGDAADRAATLTRQLLAFSRLTVLDARVIDLNKIVEEMDKILRRLTWENIAFSISLAEDLCSVKVDQSQIGQVLLNLVINARDAMPKGGTLTIATENTFMDEARVAVLEDAKPGNYVMLAVSDTGIGMQEEELCRIFEPFYTTKGPGKGTGLGLAVVHGIVKQSAGVIEVVSEPGIASTFKIYLPAVDEDRVAAGRKKSAAVREGGETILLVEDEVAVRTYAKLALEDLGYEVIEVADGREAIAVAEKRGSEIDVLLTDVVMPGMDGQHLAEELTSCLPHLKVLFVSGYTAAAAVRDKILEDRVAFLQKPYSPTALAAKVREVLGNSGTQ